MNKILLRLIQIILISTTLVGCALWKHGWETDHKTISLSEQEQRALLTIAEDGWAQRHIEEKLLASIAAYKQLVNANPSYYEGLVRLSRGYYLLADGHYTDDSQFAKRADTYKEGIRWGERAMATNKSFYDIVSTPKGNTESALYTLNKREVSAIYWTAVNLGKWVRQNGILATFKYKLQLEQMIDRVAALDPTFYYGAVDRYWGAFYSLVPGYSADDIEKSRRHFIDSLKVENYYLGTHVLYAAAYAVKVENKELFKKELEFVLKASANQVPEVKSENILEKRKAQKLLEKIDQLF